MTNSMTELIDKIAENIRKALRKEGYIVTPIAEVNDTGIEFTITTFINLKLNRYYSLKARLGNGNGKLMLMYRFYTENHLALDDYEKEYFDRLDDERRNISRIFESILEHNRTLF